MSTLCFVSPVTSGCLYCPADANFPPLFHLDPLLPTYVVPTPYMDPSPPSFTDDFTDDGVETTTSSAGSPRFLGHGLNENLIPISCSILAALVVGVVPYIVFKRSVEAKRESRLKSCFVAEDISVEGFFCCFLSTPQRQSGTNWVNHDGDDGLVGGVSRK